MTSMRRRYVASTSVRRHVPAGNLTPLAPHPPNILNLGPPNILNLPTPMLLCATVRVRIPLEIEILFSHKQGSIAWPPG